MDPKRFRSQASYLYVIQVIASYTEAFIGKSKNTLYTFEKGRAISRSTDTSEGFLILPLPEHDKLHNQVATIIISML